MRVLAMGVCSVSLLEVLVGSWTSIFLFRRRLLSLFNVVYAASDPALSRTHVLMLSPELKEELLMCCMLGPFALTLLRVPNSELLYCSDASDWGIGVVAAALPGELQKEIHRHKLRKSVWAKLLSPLRALNRVKGILPTDDELPDGSQLASHPLWIELATALSFREIVRKRMREGLRINILELRGMIRVEHEASKVAFPLRYFSLADSQVSLGAWVTVFIHWTQCGTTTVVIAVRKFGNAGFVPSEDNPADDPTRGCEVRPPQKVLRPAVMAASHGDWTVFDGWLDRYGASSYQCSGLPSLDELRRGRKAQVHLHDEQNGAENGVGDEKLETLEKMKPCLGPVSRQSGTMECRPCRALLCLRREPCLVLLWYAVGTVILSA